MDTPLCMCSPRNCRQPNLKPNPSCTAYRIDVSTEPDPNERDTIASLFGLGAQSEVRPLECIFCSRFSATPTPLRAASRRIGSHLAPSFQPFPTTPNHPQPPPTTPNHPQPPTTAPHPHHTSPALTSGTSKNESVEPKGGTAFISNGNVEFIRTTIVESHSEGPGGGFFIEGATNFTLTDSTIANSTTATDGGGLAAADAELVKLRNVEFVNLTANVRGGGVQGQGKTLLLEVDNTSFVDCAVEYTRETECFTLILRDSYGG